MKKIIFLCVLCGLMLGAVPPAQAEKPVEPVSLGTWVLNAGIGASGYSYGDDLWLYGFGVKGAIQKGLWQLGWGVVSLGGEVGMAGSSHNKLNYTRFNIAPRSSYHYGWDVPGLDTYAGLTMGIGFVGNSTVSGTNVHFYSGMYVGGSYFLSEQFGLNAEMGLGSTLLQLGVAYRF